jgi:hypothetical protein
MYIRYWWESQKERDHKEDQDIGVWAILKKAIEEPWFPGLTLKTVLN